MKKMFFIPFLGTLGFVSALALIDISSDIFYQCKKKRWCK